MAELGNYVAAFSVGLVVTVAVCLAIEAWQDRHR